MYMRSIKAINTTAGKTNYAIAVVCSDPYIIGDVKTCLMDVGATDMELAFIHLKDSKKGNKITVMLLLMLLYFATYSITGASIVRCHNSSDHRSVW